MPNQYHNFEYYHYNMNLNNRASNFRSFRALSFMLNLFVLHLENINIMSVRKWQTSKSRGSVKVSNVSKALTIPSDEFVAVLTSHT